MAFVQQLQARAQSTKADPRDHRTWPVALGRLVGHRDDKLGIEWLFSREVYDRLGLDPQERHKGQTPRRVAAGMKAHGWTRQLVGPRSARESGYCRALREDRTAPAVPVSPHHEAAVFAIRVTLERLTRMGLTGAQLDAAWDTARLAPAEPDAEIIVSL
ncbi:hypothetical protein MKK63_30810 [Methylobacterium sp. J-088]|uniref:hypothetical protein n=1 Tax=Methylobacterium sp. J-088 TaxID=2836664 RepID=UPI001FB89154|nr:hypothetical protein [Methylobacterium sp. J-088]MCJ2067049.1 hypothetical protein [Methylobacterium sp. J-088]